MATATVLTVTEHDFSNYVQTRRPWFTLYGLRLRPAGQQKQQVQLALIQQILPEEVMASVLSRVPPHSLAQAACVCSQWSAIAKRDSMWEAPCYSAFQTLGKEETLRIAQRQYRGRWRAMFLEKPHLRFDGIYVSRNTYIRTGIVEWRIKNPVHLVCYFRYLRFFPQGEFAYRTTPLPLSAVAPSLDKLPSDSAKHKPGGAEPVLKGRFHLQGTKLLCAMTYPNMVGTQIRTTLELRSTCPAANNRLDLLSIKSYDNGTSTTIPLGEQQVESPLHLAGVRDA